MTMALDDFGAGFQCDVVESIGELAEAAADGADETALLQHATRNVAAPAARPADGPPEAENAVSGDAEPIEGIRRAAEVLHLAELHRRLSRSGIRPERRHRFGDQRGIEGSADRAEAWEWPRGIVNQPERAEGGHLGLKEER